MLMRCAGLLLLVLTWTAVASAQTDYDFLIKGGRVIDGKNGISAVRDVAIKDGKIAAVKPNISWDFGPNVEAGRPLARLTDEYLRPGDILTHMVQRQPRRAGPGDQGTITGSFAMLPASTDRS